MPDNIRIEVNGKIAEIILSRPEKLNAISNAMLDAMIAALNDFSQSGEIRVVVLSGSGRAFSAGGDIAAMEAMDSQAFEETIHRYMRLARAFRQCKAASIAAVHGYALAGGFELALMCDIRMADSSARFGLPDAALGLSPTSGMTWMLPRIVGLGRAMHLTLSGKQIDAEEARQIGLVAEVFPTGQLMAQTFDLAKSIASYPGPVVEITRKLFHDAFEQDHESVLKAETLAESRCFSSPDTRAAMLAFLERRR